MTAPSLSPRPGFRWAAVMWRGPRQTRTKVCSYCGDRLPRDDPEFMPLVLWNAEGWAAEFCDHCQAAWFGLESFPEPRDPVDEPEVRGMGRRK